MTCFLREELQSKTQKKKLRNVLAQIQIQRLKLTIPGNRGVLNHTFIIFPEKEWHNPFHHLFATNTASSAFFHKTKICSQYQLKYLGYLHC